MTAHANACWAAHGGVLAASAGARSGKCGGCRGGDRRKFATLASEPVDGQDGFEHGLIWVGGIRCIGGGPTCPLPIFTSRFVAYVGNHRDLSRGVLEAQAFFANGLSPQGVRGGVGEAASATLPIGLLA